MTSKSKHTPGPWMVREAADFLQIAPPDNSEPICEMGLYPAPDWPKDEAAELMANARLIAAAPDMYEALEDLISSLEITWRNGFAAVEDVQKELEFARTAISKAKGEA